MTQGNFIDYSRQKTVNKIFAMLVVVATVVAIWLKFSEPTNESTIIVLFIGIPLGLVLLSSLFGAGSKRAIDYRAGKWNSRKVWMSFSEYESMTENYEDAYGVLFSHPGDTCGCCLLLPVIGILGVAGYIYDLSLIRGLMVPLFGVLLDSVFLIMIIYAIASVGSFIVGFRIPSIDASEFFKPLLSGDVYEFASELETVPNIRAGMNVEIGEREDVLTILEAESKAYVEGLPETVTIQVQVSHSGFAYPYLVGTVYKGAKVLPVHKYLSIKTKYPAMLEFSMDDDVTVMVARFDIPKRTSSVPNISKKDFRALANILAKELKKNYDEAQQ